MIKVAVFGYGNVGKSVVDTCLVSSDIDLVGIVDVIHAGKKEKGYKIVKTMEELPEFQAAILSLPSRLVPNMAEKLLKKGIYTADSYDIHSSIPEVRKRLNAAAKATEVASVLSAGWDPGTDSVVRTLMQAMAPNGITYTDFGPGMSMGHSVAAKAINGVKDALSMTIPTGTGIHRRMVYVQLEDNADTAKIEKEIKTDDYFANDETYVIPVDNVRSVLDVGHGVHMERKGVSGITHNQLFDFNMKINNPALTAQVLVCAVRAAVRQQPGCYTMIEVPPVDFLEMDREQAVHDLV